MRFRASLAALAILFVLPATAQDFAVTETDIDVGDQEYSPYLVDLQRILIRFCQ
jgi:hypothetical protein